MEKLNKKTWEKQYWIQLLVSVYGGDVNALLNEIEEDKSRETILWYACHQIAYLVLSKDSNWFELAMKIDYLAKIVQDEIIKNLPKWLEKDMAITEHMDTIESLSSWFFERYINTLKNTTINTYKIYVRLDIIEFQDEKSFSDDMSTIDKVILNSFSNYSETKKIEILTKVWEDAWDDFEFDIDDMQYLCQKYNAPEVQTFVKIDQKVPTAMLKIEDNLTQLVIDFGGLL